MCISSITKPYCISSELSSYISLMNKNTKSGREYRIQKVYGKEIWNSLNRLGLKEFDWNSKKILDICCGTGYLTYHLSNHVNPQNIYSFDISLSEVEQAKKLTSSQTNSSTYFVCDALNLGLINEYFDVIIGNSFLHHFYDVPFAIKKIGDFLKPNGIFILLHEPTLCAVPLEMGNLKLWIKCIMQGEKALDYLRYKGPDLVNDNGGSDVWIFDIDKIESLFSDYSSVTITPQRIARSYVVSKFNLNLSESKKHLNLIERLLFENSIRADNFLSVFLPRQYFGSFCLLAKKKS